MEEPPRVSGEQVAVWLRQLEEDNGAGHRELVERLWSLGPEASDAVPALLATLRNEASPLRGLAARWLGQVGKGSIEVSQALVDATQANDEHLRNAATIALGDLACASDTVVERLTEQLGYEGELLRVYSARALVLLRPGMAEAMQVLRAARASDDCWVRDTAAEALAALCSTFASAIDDVILFLDDDYEPTIEGIAWALAKAPADAVVPRLLEVLQHGATASQAGALYALREIGTNAHAFREQVIEALVTTRAFEAEPTLRRRAANVAQALELDAPVVCEKLRVLLNDQSHWVAEQAARALLSFPRLEADVRGEATAAIARIWPGEDSTTGSDAS